MTETVRRARQPALSAKCARALWPQANALAEAHPVIGPAPAPTIYGLLQFVVRAINCMIHVPKPRRAALEGHVMSLDVELAAFMSAEDYIALLRDISLIDGPKMARELAESFKCDPDIDFESMASFLLAGRVQLSDRLRAIQELERWGAGRSRALHAYLQVEKKVAAEIRARNLAFEEILSRHNLMPHESQATSTHRR